VAEQWNARTVRRLGEELSNWGRWGPDDERGTLNFITPECVLAACALPRRGLVISCALPFDQDGPQEGPGPRHNPVHTMLASGEGALAGEQNFPGGFQYADDAITMPLQCGTQWDGLAHVFYDGKMYNDRDIALVTRHGAQSNGIEHMANGVVGRGVLLDLPRALGRPWLDDGTPVFARDLDVCAERLGVTIERGDILLVRTGMLTRCLAQDSFAGYCGGSAPGLSLDCARWLYEREIAAVATDTWSVEVRPHETPDCIHPLHMVALRDMGLLFGEIFQLDRLSEACADDGLYAFLFAAPPLPVTGAVGSPINPVAIK